MEINQMKIIIRAFYALVLILPFSWANAQQEPYYAQNMFNQISYNPGFAGSVGGICAHGLMRQQWVGFKDEDGNSVAPQTYTLSIHSPVNLLHGGVGVTFYQDKIGFQKETGLKIMYAFRVDIGMGNLGIGVQAGFINGLIDFNSLINGAKDPDDPILAGKADESDMMLDFGLGLHYLIPNKFYVGLSTSRLSESQSDILAYKTKRHYYLSAGYEISFPNNPSFVIEPSLLVKSDAVKTQLDVAALLKYNNKVWGGVSYSSFRVMDPFSIILGLKIKDLRIGYAYTIPTSSIGSSGSHEVMVGYCFKINIDKGRRSYRNTRFL